MQSAGAPLPPSEHTLSYYSWVSACTLLFHHTGFRPAPKKPSSTLCLKVRARLCACLTGLRPLALLPASCLTLAPGASPLLFCIGPSRHLAVAMTLQHKLHAADNMSAISLNVTSLPLGLALLLHSVCFPAVSSLCPSLDLLMAFKRQVRDAYFEVLLLSCVVFLGLL